MKTGSHLLLLCLLALLWGCESTDSANISIGNITEDIETYRLTSITEAGIESNIDFVVILRASTDDKPYLRLSGGDELSLIVGGQVVPFVQESDNDTDAIRYVASWTEAIQTPTPVTVRFTRGSGETYDSNTSLNAPPAVTEPVAGFAWNPDSDDLVVSWESVDPPVDDAAVFTACTRYYIILETSGLSFTVAEDALVQTDTRTSTCHGYVELIQETLEGVIDGEFHEDSDFTIDQATQVDVTAEY